MNAAPGAARKAAKNTPQRNVLDLSVFGLEHDLEEAHFSLSISGSDDDTWIAYGFADDTLDEDNEDNEDDEDNEQNEDEQPDTGEFTMDPMAPGGEVDMKMHRGGPREYFLTVYDVRIREASEKWCDVVDTLEDHLVCLPSRRSSCVLSNVCRQLMCSQGNNHPSALIQFSDATSHNNGNPADRYLRTRDAINYLEGIQGILNKIISGWETFASHGGDIEFFRTPGSYRNSDSEEHVHRLLASITNTFVVLKERQQVLLALQESCQASRKDVCLDSPKFHIHDASLLTENSSS
jgi:hypothetical protein